MKRILSTVVVLTALFLNTSAQKGSNIIVIETSMGTIEVLLYDDTPLHRDNMIKLVNQQYFDGQLFHRVIKNFMIQAGDPHSKNAPVGQRLGTGGPGYKIPAEFRDHLYHKKGVLSAAREGDRSNPQKKSSGSQFYIVQGNVFTKDQLLSMQSSGHHDPFTPEEIEAYTTVGGTPHLDGGYTVFGEVVKGLEIIDAIAAVKTDPYDRPIEDVVYNIYMKK